MTQDEFAAKVGISRMALVRFEQGTIPTPSLKFKPFLETVDLNAPTSDSDPYQALCLQYLEYQNTKRALNFGILDDSPDFFEFTQERKKHNADHLWNPTQGPPPSALPHPLMWWASVSPSRPSLTELCVALCLHLPTLHKFVNGPFPLEVPFTLISALRESGYSLDTVKEFAWEYAACRVVLARQNGGT